MASKNRISPSDAVTMAGLAAKAAGVAVAPAAVTGAVFGGAAKLIEAGKNDEDDE